MAPPPLATALAPVAAHAPAAFGALLRARRAVEETLERPLLDAVRGRVEAELGLAEEEADGAADERTAAVLGLAEQFVAYVPGVGEEHREPVRAALGADGLRSLVEALYVLDQTTRLRLEHVRLFERAPARAPGAVDGGSPLREAVADIHAQAMLLGRLDPLTTEIVRLRCADYHDCKT